MLSGRCFAGLSLGLLLFGGCEDGGSEAVDANVSLEAGTWPEAGSGMDAAPGDAGTDAVVGADGCVPFVMPDNCTIPENSALYSDLRCTGLYGRFEQRELACNVEGYVPAYPLWSD